MSSAGTERACAGTADATRAALLALVRLHELGGLRFCDESGAAVHIGAARPSPQESSGRRAVVRREDTGQTAPPVTRAVCLHDGGTG